tara:strand:- start:1419 stop:1640 length:222 start_codon:yes stop_codon:yes gene_type:complete
MIKIKDLIKKYKSMSLISDDGFQAIVHTNNYNYGGNKINAILVFNNDDGDGLYGKPVSVICGTAYDIITKLNK